MNEIGITALIIASLVLVFFRPFDGNPEPSWVGLVRVVAALVMAIGSIAMIVELLGV